MQPLPAIPTPRAQRWRDFRMHVMPIIVFVTGVAMVAYLWNKNLAPSAFVGEVERIQASVVSPDVGVLVLTNLTVARFQPVKAGEVLGYLDTGDPRTAGTLTVLRARFDLMRLESSYPELDQQRNRLDVERLRSDLMRQQVDLATARINLQRAENESARVTRLHEAGLVSESEYDLALKTKEALAVDVSERTKLVAELDRRVKDLDSLVEVAVGVQRTNLLVQSNQLARAEQRLGLFPLLAPIDGVVTQILHRDGEIVTRGEPIFTISKDNPDHIVGYVRQPVSFQPRIGMDVEIRTRGPRRQTGMAKIVQVGPEMELFSQPLRVRGFGAAQERGLPVLIDLPEGMRVYPGELVDLFLKSAN